MAKHLIDFQDTDSAKGISYETLSDYASRRDCSVDELVNIVMADFLGFQPDIADTKEWEERLRKAGIPPYKPTVLPGLVGLFRANSTD